MYEARLLNNYIVDLAMFTGQIMCIINYKHMDIYNYLIINYKKRNGT